MLALATSIRDISQVEERVVLPLRRLTRRADTLFSPRVGCPRLWDARICHQPTEIGDTRCLRQWRPLAHSSYTLVYCSRTVHGPSLR